MQLIFITIHKQHKITKFLLLLNLLTKFNYNKWKKLYLNIITIETQSLISPKGIFKLPNHHI